MKAILKNLLAACVLIATLGSSCALAQGWPDKPIHLLVSTPAGGPIDALARILGQGVAKTLGQPVIVENRVGASGAIALGYATKQPADGYTILITANAAFTLVPIVRSMPYRPLDDFTFLGQLVFTPDIFVVPASSPARDMKQFVALAKSQPGKLNYGSMVGIPQHLDFERFKKESGTDIVLVPYTGGSPIVIALMGGQIDVTLFNAPLVAEGVKSGKLRALATAAKSRSALMPDVPTLAQAGFAGVELSGGSFYSLAAPAGLPKEVANKLYQAFSAAVLDGETRRKLEAVGFEAALRDGAALREGLKRELAGNEKLVKSLDIKLTE